MSEGNHRLFILADGSYACGCGRFVSPVATGHYQHYVHSLLERRQRAELEHSRYHVRDHIQNGATTRTPARVDRHENGDTAELF